MPNFPHEFREKLRLDRIYESKKEILSWVKKFPESRTQMIKQAQEDILTEQFRLEQALAQVKQSKANLKQLAKKKKLLEELKDE